MKFLIFLVIEKKYFSSETFLLIFKHCVNLLSDWLVRGKVK